MIKGKVIGKQKMRKAEKYPYLGVCNGLVVLFNGPKRGMVVFISDDFEYSEDVNEKTVENVGYYSTDWVEHGFVPFDAIIVLENKTYEYEEST